MSTAQSLPLDAIRQMFDAHGKLIYGEQVNQIEHSLQCATLAHKAGAKPALVVAAMLHDVGHILHRDAAGALLAGNDDKHEVLGARYLSRWFGPDVTEPIALHVEAKRYLCATDAGYHARLSPVSQRSLELQGGPLSVRDARAFESNAHAADALLVRQWDDLGKQPGMATLTLDDCLSIAQGCLQSR